MKQVIIGLVAVVAIIGGAVIFGKEEQAAGIPSEFVYGNAESSVTVVEYGDFECPACRRFLLGEPAIGAPPILEEIKDKYKDTVRFEFRHFPLVQIHFNAQAAHRAAEAAGKQDKFWEMHDLLYERQSAWRADVQSGGHNGGAVASNNNPGPTFEGYAEELGLDLEKFKADVKAPETLATINADIEKGKADGASGTPSFVINGERIEELTSLDTVAEFSALIDAALNPPAEEAEDPTEGEGAEAEEIPAKPEESAEEAN